MNEVASESGSKRVSYSPELGELICERIAEGESLRRIAQTEGMPKPSTIVLWAATHAEFGEQYARAKEVQADVFFEQIAEIAHDGSEDWVMTKFGPQLDAEHVQRSKLRVDTLKWQASKLAPKKYGDAVKHVGADGESAIQFVVTRAGTAHKEKSDG